jgi:hypothetical protein
MRVANETIGLAGGGMWKTHRPKRGMGVIEIEAGDVLRIGGQDFKVQRHLGDKRLLVRRVPDEGGRRA